MASEYCDDEDFVTRVDIYVYDRDVDKLRRLEDRAIQLLGRFKSDQDPDWKFLDSYIYFDHDTKLPEPDLDGVYTLQITMECHRDNYAKVCCTMEFWRDFGFESAQRDTCAPCA